MNKEKKHTTDSNYTTVVFETNKLLFEKQKQIRHVQGRNNVKKRNKLMHKQNQYYCRNFSYYKISKIVL